jgi:hypothetical protein
MVFGNLCQDDTFCNSCTKMQLPRILFRCGPVPKRFETARQGKPRPRARAVPLYSFLQPQRQSDSTTGASLGSSEICPNYCSAVHLF